MLVDRCSAALGLNRAHDVEARVQNLGNSSGVANVVVSCEVAQMMGAVMRTYVKVLSWPRTRCAVPRSHEVATSAVYVQSWLCSLVRL